MVSAQTRGVWIVEVSDADRLVDRCFDPGRKVPLVIVSLGSTEHGAYKTRIDPDELSYRLDGTAPAELAMFASVAAVNAFSRRSDIGELATYGGAVRIVAPGASRTDHWKANPLIIIKPEDDVDLKLGRIVFEVQRLQRHLDTPRPTSLGADPKLAAALAQARDQLAAPPVPADPTPAPRHRPTPADPTGDVASGETVVSAVPPPPVPEPTPEPAPASEPEPGPEPVPSAPASPVLSAADLDEMTTKMTGLLDKLVERVGGRVKDVIVDLLGGTSDETARERSRAAAAEQELEVAREKVTELREQVASLRAETASLDSDSGLPVVYRDREAQFRWEVETTYLTAVPDDGRPQLRGFQVTDEFLDGLDEHIVPRAKVVGICVDILTRSAWRTRDVHQWGESKTGPARQSDAGGVGWRAYVKVNSPGAPRLNWFEEPDGTALFAQVGHHDSAIR